MLEPAQTQTVIPLISLVSSFASGVVGTIVGAVLASFKVDKRMALLEQKITLLFEGPTGLLQRMSNLESAINARRIDPSIIREGH